MNQSKTHKCVIVGAGFSGICLGIKLKSRGIDDFILLEKADEVGGTWRDNHYPGAECDVPSALYSFSFETKTDWDYQWSEQPQILEYIKNTARKHDLAGHIKFGCQLASASFDAATGQWVLVTAQGETLHTKFLISAVGQLHKPRLPAFKGTETFKGPMFHSANWNHAVELKGKSVAVIGNAASAVQFIPWVAREAGTLLVFQRSANWVSRKRDRPYKDWEKKLLRLFPFFKRVARLKTYLRNEMIAYPAIKGNRVANWLVKAVCLNYLNSTVTDAALRQKLLPDYPIGAKRILVAEGYYEALTRSNVELVTDPIDAIDDRGILTRSGRHCPCDVIIFGTGFVTNPFLADIAVTGRSGRLLSEHWSAGAMAYLGIATSEFPNLFFMYGPNTNLGHNSILLMSEPQADYIIQALEEAERRDASSVEVRKDIEERYNHDLQARLQGMVWNSVTDSWYKSGGLVTNNWPGSVGEYRQATRKFRAEDYEMRP